MRLRTIKSRMRLAMLSEDDIKFLYDKMRGIPAEDIREKYKWALAVSDMYKRKEG